MHTEVGVTVTGGVGVGDSVGISDTHVQAPDTIWHVPRRHADSGQIVPGVHEGQRAQVPLHGSPEHGSVGVGSGDGVSVIVAVGIGVGATCTSMTRGLPLRSIVVQAMKSVPPQVFTSTSHTVR
jgi:hypothetical protein